MGNKNIDYVQNFYSGIETILGSNNMLNPLKDNPLGLELCEVLQVYVFPTGISHEEKKWGETGYDIRTFHE